MHPMLTIYRSARLARRTSVAATLGFCAVALVAFCAREARAQACVPEGCLPPPGSAYGGPFTHHFNFLGTTVDLGNLSLHSFTSCSAPPPSVPNASTTISFNAIMDFVASVNGGPPSAGPANAQATILVRFNQQLGPTRYFDTEMLQLDLSGGALPSGALVRESPTLASYGQTSIEDLGGGKFRIDSFFDVFFELSLDGGVNWVPGLNGPGRMTLTGPGCPTPTRRSSWGRVKITYR